MRGCLTGMSDFTLFGDRAIQRDLFGQPVVPCVPIETSGCSGGYADVGQAYLFEPHNADLTGQGYFPCLVPLSEEDNRDRAT
jgi:hypothetical protein